MRKKFEKFISFSEFSVKRFLIPVNYMLMLKLKRSFVIIIYLFYNQFLFSKELPNDYVVPVEFSSIDKKKLDRAEELLKEGIDLWHQLNAMYNPENVRSKKIDSIYNIQAYSILVKAAKCFFEGTNAKYEVYHKNCLEFWAKHKYDSPSGLDNAKRMQKEALNYFEQARLNRRVAENYVNQYVYAYDRLYEAISLEIIATKKEGRALQVYLDWPVHYAYEWDEDVEVDLFNPKTQLVVKKEEPKIVQPQVQEELPDSMIIYYEVQIAAHTVPITENYIRENVYKGNLKILERREEGWFKYTIGHFKTFDEADRLLNQVNIAKAFVVAYKNEKRVTIKEADQKQ